MPVVSCSAYFLVTLTQDGLWVLGNRLSSLRETDGDEADPGPREAGPLTACFENRDAWRSEGGCTDHWKARDDGVAGPFLLGLPMCVQTFVMCSLQTAQWHVTRVCQGGFITSACKNQGLPESENGGH